MTAIGVAWIAIMTVVCVIGIEVNARTQRWLLTAEIVTLAVFAAVALVRVWLGPRRPRFDHPDAVLVQPVRDRLDGRADRRPADRDLHLLGLGQPR